VRCITSMLFVRSKTAATHTMTVYASIQVQTMTPLMIY
jgi:hypothetical protein